MNDPLRLPCPTCSGTRSTTTGDRHADTNMDVCATCHDEGTIPARPGETPEASFGFVNRNTTATAGKDFPKMGMSFPKSGNEAQTISAAASGAERVDEARVEAAMDAFYPGEDWRLDLGIALPNSLRDMRAAIAAADAAAEILMPAEGAGLREAAQMFISHYPHGINPFLDRAHTLASTALVSSQPTVEGPVAAGVGVRSERVLGELMSAAWALDITPSDPQRLRLHKACEEACVALRAALSVAPAARPGDGVGLTLQEAFSCADAEDWRRLDGFLGESGYGRFWKAVFAQIRTALAAAPAADGGRA